MTPPIPYPQPPATPPRYPFIPPQFRTSDDTLPPDPALTDLPFPTDVYTGEAGQCYDLTLLPPGEAEVIAFLRALLGEFYDYGAYLMALFDYLDFFQYPSTWEKALALLNLNAEKPEMEHDEDYPSSMEGYTGYFEHYLKIKKYFIGYFHYSTFLGTILEIWKEIFGKHPFPRTLPDLRTAYEQYRLYGNSINAISLTGLSSGNSSLFSFPECIKYLPHLTRIHLSGLDIYSFRHLPPTLTALSFDGCLFNRFLQSPPYTPNLTHLTISGSSLPTYRFLPPTLTHLTFDGMGKLHLPDFPSDLPHLTHLTIYDCKCHHLYDLPRSFPALQSLRIEKTPLHSLSSIPHCPTLQKCLISKTHLSNLASVGDFRASIPCSAELTNLHPISPYGDPFHNTKFSSLTIKNIASNCQERPYLFPQSYRSIYAAILHNYDDNNPFSDNPDALALLYSTGTILSEFHRDRIIYEGTETTLKLLLNKLGSHDPLVQALADRLELTVAKYLFKLDHISI